MTMDERIEAAAEVGRLALMSRGNHSPISLVRLIAEAVVPELSGDKPTHWLAPMEADRASDIVKGAWRQLRDAYLGKGDGG